MSLEVSINVDIGHTTVSLYATVDDDQLNEMAHESGISKDELEALACTEVLSVDVW